MSLPIYVDAYSGYKANERDGGCFGTAVTIEGERKCEHEETEEGVYRCERSYGHFRREIPLPEGVKTGTAKAYFKNGTLAITFDAPKTAKNGRRLEIGQEPVGAKKGEPAA